MDQVTQQNAANSEESSSAAEQLAGQATELAEMIARFRLSKAGAKATKRHPLAAPKAVAARAVPKGATPAKPTGGKSRSTSADAFMPMDDDPDFANF
jgi:methyl-accepting chemotaxis protein